MGLFKPAMSDKEEDVEEFEQVGSGASLTVPVMAGNLKKGSFVVIKNRPCKIVDTSTSKTGKHGHAKVHMVALDIFTGAKKEDICPSSHNMQQPVVFRDDFQLADIDDEGYVSLMREDGTTKDDLKLPENDVGELIRKDYAADKQLLITVVRAMGDEQIMGSKEMQN